MLFSINLIFAIVLIFFGTCFLYLGLHVLFNMNSVEHERVRNALKVFKKTGYAKQHVLNRNGSTHEIQRLRVLPE